MLHLKTLTSSCLALVVLLLGFGIVQGQPKAFYPIASKIYTIEDGLFDRCVDIAFQDSAGRLEIIPCGTVQSAHQVYMYTFDGFRAFMKNLDGIPRSGQWSLVPTDASNSGILHGYLLEIAQSANPVTKYFTLDYASAKLEVLDAPRYQDSSVNIRSVKIHHNDVYLIGQLPGKIFVYKREDDSWRETVNARAPGAGGVLRFELACLVEDDVIWAETYNGTGYRIDLTTSRVDTIPGQRLLGRTENDFLRLPGGQLLYTVGARGEVYLIDEQNLTRSLFNPEWTAPTAQGVNGQWAFEDDIGNVLFIRSEQGKPYSGWLIDKDNVIHDYSAPLEGMPSAIKGLKGLEINGRDFRKGFFITGEEFAAVEVTTREAVTAVPFVAVRGCMEFPDGTMLVKRGQIYNGVSIVPIEGGDGHCLSFLHGDGDLVRLHHDEYQYLFGTNKQGMFLYDAVDRSCTKIIPEGEVSRLCLAPNGQIYAWNEDVLKVIDPDSYESAELIDSPFTYFINALFASSDNDLYVGSSDGLYILDPDRRKLNKIDLEVGEEVQQVLSIYEDKTGRLWIGTYRFGIVILDPATGEKFQITADDGLSSNAIASTIEDGDGDIWVGTFNGITIFNQEARLIGYLYEKGGLVDNECNRWSAFRLSDDRLFFGTPRGFSIINPGIIKQNIKEEEQRLIYPMELEYDDILLTGGEPGFRDAISEGITIPAVSRSLRISYGLSSYAAPASNSFAYKLDRPGNEWNFVGGLRQLSLTDLPVGNYDLRIKGADFQGRSSVNQIVIPLHVKAFFYQQWWFYLLASLPFIALGLLWVLRERSERVRLEAEVTRRTDTIRQQTEELKQMDKLKTRLYTNITHEFRTPLTVIRGLADKVGEDEIAPAMIKRNADSLLDLVNQMLDLRKLESGNLKFEPIQANVVSYLSYLGETFRSLAEQKGQHFHFLSPHKDVVMDFDPNKLARVVSNLLSNAIKFTPEGGDIYLQLDSNGNYSDEVTIKVTDTGIGIPEQELSRIFDRFYQVDNSTTRRGEGTGVGLTLASELVSLMSGEIKVFSTSGQGTTFEVRLPVTNQAEIRSYGDYPGIQSSATADTTTAKIQHTQSSGASDDLPLALVVEDNPDVIHFIGKCLESEYKLIIAMDGAEGIDKAIQEVPDVIVSDVMMPEKDGFELLETLKKDARTSHIPIVLLTAKADYESKLEGLVRGADAYLPKPFDEEELRIRLRKLIDLRSALQERYSQLQTLEPSNDVGVTIEDEFIGRIRSTLKANLDDENFGINELCEEMNVSRTQMHNKLKALTGKSTSLYIRSLRLAEAKELMATKPDLNISEVAFEVGFKDPKYFAKVFKQEFGVTPTVWQSK